MYRQDYKKNNQEGFVALFSVVIIALILGVITFSLSASGFFLRFNVLESEFKRTGLGLAETCAQKAMEDIFKGSITIPQTITVGTDSCRICNVTGSGTGPYTILTRALKNKSYTNLTASVNIVGANMTVNSWQEQATYTGPVCTLP